MKEYWIVDYLQTYYEEVTPREFYRDVFPIGELEEKGIKVKGKYTGVAVELSPKAEEGNIKRYSITDDLETIDTLLSSDHFIIISPISYAGKSRKSENARYIYGLAIDLDGVDSEQHLKDLLHQIEKVEYLPKPTYLVSSGTGIHLYYLFKQPIPCFKNIAQELHKLKNALTKKIWNKYVTTLYDKPQIQSVFQGFRMVGGITKIGTRVKAFAMGERVDIEYLNEFVQDKDRVKHVTYKSKLTLDQAKELYPEWHEKRIIKKRKRGTWITNKSAYDWWLNRIKHEATEGHRYNCVMCLAIYGVKCGIEYAEVEKDAFSLIERMDILTTREDNHFTRDDVLSALELHNDNYITYPIRAIIEVTGIHIEKNKRNFRKQKDHIKIMNFVRDEINHNTNWRQGNGRPKGSGTKRSIIEEWQKVHPWGTKAQCVKDLNLSKPTVYKYWKQK